MKPWLTFLAIFGIVKYLTYFGKIEFCNISNSLEHNFNLVVLTQGNWLILGLTLMDYNGKSIKFKVSKTSEHRKQ